MAEHVTIITGAGSGIGRVCAVMLARRGHRLVLAGRRREALEETASEAQNDSLVLTADVGDPGSPSAIIDAAIERFGRIDALVNNAGHAPLRDIGETTPEIVEEVFRINAHGPANLIAKVWPIMRRQGGGRIVNVSSMAASDPFPGLFAYAAAKASVELMVKSCASEGRSHGIRAFAVAPGAVETAMLRANFSEKQVPKNRCLSPDDVAAVIVACVVGERDADNGKTIRLPSP